MLARLKGLSGAGCLLSLTIAVPAAGGEGGQPALLTLVSQGAGLNCEEALDGLSSLTPKARRRQSGETADDWRQRVLGSLVGERRLAQEALSLGLDGESDFAGRWSRVRKSRLLAEMERSLVEGLTVSTAEVERYYEIHRGRFSAPERAGSSFILLRLPERPAPEEIADVERRLGLIRREQQAGRRFGELAREHSEAENARRGGAVATSPRGTLNDTYEEAMWALDPGEVSQPVRLPDGMALIRLDHVFPAGELSLEEASARIEKELLAEKSAAAIADAVDRARALWPASVDWVVDEASSDGTAAPSIVFDGEPLDLGDLGLANRPPRLAERVDRALARRWLVRLAEEEGLSTKAELADELDHLRRRMLAAEALDRRITARLPTVDDNALRQLYNENLQSLAGPQRRLFEVVFLPGVEGQLRSVHGEAEEVARVWSESAERPAIGGAEIWGPLRRTVLGNSTTPRLAEVAFSLKEGEVSAPVRMERYRSVAARFRVEGYVVLRLLAVEGPEVPSLEEARARLVKMAHRSRVQVLEGEVRAEVLAEPELVFDAEALTDCLPAPPAQ